MDNEMIVNGQPCPCLLPVTTWKETGLEFKAGQGYNKKRVQPLELVVYHWTAGELSIKQLYDVLVDRKLGIEFAISGYGQIYQFCDPAQVDTADANYANARSVGVEIVNYGIKEPPPTPGADRLRYRSMVHNTLLHMAHFRTPQMVAALALADALSRAIPAIARMVPLENGRLLHRTLTVQEVAAFKGHLGHFHINLEKVDPGIDLLEVLHACWGDQLL